jgi:2-keto-4-pentenoate hydratase/2-oxohepta-3-ene-1,7-dioic acid hydratase in catechol pathway
MYHNTEIDDPLVRFSDPAGQIRVGEWTESGIELPGESIAFDEVDVLPPVDPGKVVGVTPNHSSQFNGDEIPEIDIFLKPSNVVVGHDRQVNLPLRDEVINYEAELGVVIGTHCSDITSEQASSVVTGFTCTNDLTKVSESTLNRQKVFSQAIPTGPVLAGPDAVPTDATIEMHVNGSREQRFTRDEYARPVERVVSEVSSLIALEPGDIITMGTATGIGALSAGDKTEVYIEGIGTLRTRFVDGS